MRNNHVYFMFREFRGYGQYGSACLCACWRPCEDVAFREKGVTGVPLPLGGHGSRRVLMLLEVCEGNERQWEEWLKVYSMTQSPPLVPKVAQRVLRGL